MAKLLFILFGLVTRTSGDVTGANLTTGACLCIKTFSGLNIRSSPCGYIVDTVRSGHCFKYLGLTRECKLGIDWYESFQINFNGIARWAGGIFLNLSPGYRCRASPLDDHAGTSDGYTCRITDEGMRIHETLSPTVYDCRDCEGGNTCKGGQCVAYIKCRCTKNGKYPPQTSCWRPGTKIMRSDGTCNDGIPENTAIATFPNGTFHGHAAVFVRCEDKKTIKVYHQWCGQAISYRNYDSSHPFFSQFAVVTNPGGACQDRPSWECRVEEAGPNKCCQREQCPEKDKYKCV